MPSGRFFHRNSNATAQPHNMALKRETSLLDLNDDCLFETFSWLPLLDLCVIRNSCSRLRTVADNYVGRTHKLLNTKCTPIKNDQYSPIYKEEILQVLSSFGHQIDALTLNRDDFSTNALSDVLLPMLDAFCKKHRLQHLKLSNFSFSDDFVTSCSHPFENLKGLTLDECTSYTTSIDEFIEKCTGLTHLEVIHGNIDFSFLKQEYPLLRQCSVNSSRIDSEIVTNFISKNKQLNELNMVQCNECNGVDDSIFISAAEHLSDLEKLTLRTILVTPNFKANLMELLNLRKLRKLEIDCNYETIDDFLKGLAVKNQLDSLGLASVELTDEVCNDIGNLKNLHNLKLVKILDSVKPGQFRSIAAALPNLKELEIASSDSVTFDDIVEFVENSPKLVDIMISSCKNVIPFDRAQFNRLAEVCAKRPTQQKLTFHIDCHNFHTMREDIKGPLRRKHARIVELIELTDEKTDFTALEEETFGYFAEEGGALDYDDFGDEFDDYDDYDEYDDYDDYDTDGDESDLIRMNEIIG